MKAAFSFLALLGLTFLVGIQNASAITATETIEDLPPYDFIIRDLQRTRTDSNGYLAVENLDSIIESENQINNLGFYNFADVSFRHVLTWLTPPAGMFTSASLTISAFGNDAGDDQVITETINLGNLQNDPLFVLESFSTTIFNSFNPAQLSLLLADGFLNVVVNKNSPGGFANLDFLSVYKSTLTVEYSPVPEPATAALLGSAALLGAVRRRRRA